MDSSMTFRSGTLATEHAWNWSCGCLVSWPVRYVSHQFACTNGAGFIQPITRHMIRARLPLTIFVRVYGKLYAVLFQLTVTVIETEKN
jgi:hypothetical protein